VIGGVRAEDVGPIGALGAGVAVAGGILSATDAEAAARNYSS
jgi:thiamine monophosphate synthase